ncbi:hypothetical protein [Thermoanaerobacterium sp. PSU-2]|nr:hypothetical protein [Thermoanaerobacterium sp. PSU-2]
MVGNTVVGAIYLSLLDMILLIVFLFLIDGILRLFPFLNKISKYLKSRR